MGDELWVLLVYDQEDPLRLICTFTWTCWRWQGMTSSCHPSRPRNWLTSFEAQS